MKILQVNTVISYGSTGVICQNIARGLINLGHDCLTVYGRGDDVGDIPTKKIGNKFEQGIHYLQSRFLDRHGLGSYFATQELLRIIKEYQPDVIHLHNIHGYYLNYKVLFQALGKIEIPIVWLLHDQWAISGGSATETVLLRADEVIDNSIKRSIEERKQYPKLFKLSLTRTSKNFIDKYESYQKVKKLTLVTPSKWLATLVSRSFLGKFPIKVINNGLSISQFDMEVQKKSVSSPLKILGVANVWVEDKGIDFFNRLADDLNVNYQITLIGLDDSILTSPNIIRVGRISSKRLIDYYKKSDIFVNPTLKDNFPTVNIEAQLCGTPVITFDTGGSGESICRETGRVIPIGNYEELLLAVEQSCKKDLEVARITREHAEQFSLEEMVFKYIALYEEVKECI